MAREDQLWRIAHDCLARGQPVVLCTLVTSIGSTPRELGARMIVGPDGLLAGTVGGGCGEAEVLTIARKIHAGFSSATLVDVDLSGNLQQSEKQACGGEMQVCVELLSQDTVEWVCAVAKAEADRAPVVLVSRLAVGEQAPCHVVVTVGERGNALKTLPSEVAAAVGNVVAENCACVVAAASGERWMLQVVGTRNEVIIVGSGHVAQPLAALASQLGWRVVIIDDRPALANPTMFPTASDIRIGAHAAELSRRKLDGHSHVVIVTRGHEHDEAALRAALAQNPAYIGMIGSRRRAIATLKKLAQAGFDKQRLDRVRSPIGLDIGAQTPEEIALAIMAEIVAVRHGASGAPMCEIRNKPKPSKCDVST